ncbi:PHD-finger domain-containing protein [Hamiltosporidium tvaerminnensis]|uniref:PHD-finger domain-containing protein n=2 Tax=Hamiltosporidium TaxID=1176354 RepID=A0A4Q9LN55_9MICR|nr:PHD-finger domain-containing protein [Hamiltosporidium tvaerminnensis]TBU03561.1 PHD-finger domain-containing protein [Hamiltosporidium magnivora]TBU08901.1 PHD-finger domain-containing protein [Hamiltosporidium magnivora]TBU17617.1 PHD-finger domain-containing protein [Hamiltosporidium tvaerminnensis]
MLLKTSLDTLEEIPIQIQQALTKLKETESKIMKYQEEINNKLSKIENDTSDTDKDLNKVNSALLNIYKHEKDIEVHLSHLHMVLDEQMCNLEETCENFKEIVCKTAIPLKNNRITGAFGVSRTNQSEKQDIPYCYCRKGAEGPMVACDGPECSLEWFHNKCVGLKAPPVGKWLCKECQEKTVKEK